MEDEPLAGSPSTSKTDDNVERMRSLVRSDRRLTLRMYSSELNFNRFTVHQILTLDLNMRKVCAKMVPNNLTTEQKDYGIRPREKTPKSGVAHCKLSLSQESENEQIQNQIAAHLFF